MKALVLALALMVTASVSQAAVIKESKHSTQKKGINIKNPPYIVTGPPSN